MEIDDDSIGIIKLKLDQINANSIIESIHLNFETKNVNVSAIDLKKAKELKDIWQDISKLSVGGYTDFHFFQQLCVQDVHNSPIYNTAMDKIGYKRANDAWKLVTRPNESIVIENIYKFCLYSYIVQSKTAVPKKVIPNIEREPIVIPQERTFPNVMSTLGSYFVKKSSETLPISYRPVPVANTANKWKCNICECTSGNDKSVCDACESARPRMNKWSCPKCTFINDNTAFCCETCGAPKDSDVVSMDRINLRKF